MKRQIDWDLFSRLIAELSEYTLIVEGRKDAAALKALFEAFDEQALKGPISPLKTLGLTNIVPINGQPLADMVMMLDGGQVVILTDYDSEGKRLAARLLRLLQRRRIKSNPRLRRMIMTHTGITRVEELAAFSAAALNKEKGDFHGETGANFYEIHSKGKHKG
jgi:5S rRNA maturation endonuclease (ribonuclease M5)